MQKKSFVKREKEAREEVRGEQKEGMSNCNSPNRSTKLPAKFTALKMTEKVKSCLSWGL